MKWTKPDIKGHLHPRTGHTVAPISKTQLAIFGGLSGYERSTNTRNQLNIVDVLNL
jgi:hypothetical protein